jgi:O-antigen ligase
MVKRVLQERLVTPQKAIFGSFCFFIITLYGPYVQFNNVAIILLGLAWIYAGNYRNLRMLLSNKVALGMLIWYVFQVCTVFYSVNKENAYKWMEYRSPLFYLPFFLGTSVLTKEEIKKCLRLFAWSTAIACTLAIGYGIFMTIHTGDTGYLYNDSLGILFEKQAVYFAMYVNFAVVIFLYGIHENSFKSKAMRNLAVCAVIFMTGFVYLLACRTALAMLLLVIGGYMAYMIYKRKQYLTGAILVLGLILGGALSFKLFPKAASRLLFVTQTNYNYESNGPADHFNGAHTANNWNSVNTRLAIWSCSREVISDHWLYGTGIGDSEDALISQYDKHHFAFAMQYRLNSHNQYLDVALSYGLLGVLVFIPCIFFFPLRAAWKRKDTVFLFFMISLVIYMITEVMLSRNQGLAFIGFFVVLMSVPVKQEREG